MKIIVLPGLDGTGSLLTDFAKALSTQNDVITFKYPNDLFKYNDLESWTQHQLSQDPFVIVAESFSGPLAIQIAVQKPTGLVGIVFVATFAKSPRKLPASIAILLNLMPLKSKFLVALLQPFVMGRWTTKTFRKKFHHTLQTVPSQTIKGRLKEVLRSNETLSLAKIEVPSIYLRASNDRLMHARCADEFGAHGIRVISLEGPHFLLQANPRKTAEVVNDFIRKL